MISIYLQPDKTQIVKGKMKKNNILDIDTTLEIPSYWDCLVGRNEAGLETEGKEENDLRDLFETVKDISSTKYEEIYLVVSDIIFSMVGVFPFVSDSLLMDSIKQKIGEDIDDYYISTPIETRPPANSRKTVYAIQKKYIDQIVQAAKDEDVSITGIEAASMSFVRSMQEYVHDYAFVEIFQNESAILTFSPIGGIYRNDAPRMGEKELIDNPQSAETVIAQNFAANNFNGGSFFGSFSPDLNYYILTENQNIFTIPSAQKTNPMEQLLLPNFIESQIPDKEQANWMIAVGALLQSIEADVLYPYKQSSLLIQTGNLLPVEMQEATKQKQWKAVAQRSFKGLAAIFLTVICAESAGILYFNSVSIDPALKANYEKAMVSKKDVDAEMKSFKKSMQDEPHVMEAYEHVLRSRPNDCNLTKLIIGSRDGKNNKFANQYVQIKAVSHDQIVFNDFIAALQDDDMFQNPSITSINGTKEVMNASISIGKKGGSSK